VTSVDFYLRGGSQHDVPIGTGRLSLYGWITLWDTKTVPNGTYTLQSVAHDAAGGSSRSKAITITVRN
jgi:hypothetical protein